MKPAKIKSGTHAVLLALLLAGILTIVNLYANRNFFRVDLTQNRRYTVAESTRKILAGLDDIVTIKVYLSRKLPPYAETLSDQIKDMLEEYSVYAGGMLSIEYIDPADDPALQRSLQFMGIPQLQLNIVERDQAAIANVYMGLAVLYGDKKEIIPTLAELDRFEYELTGKILRVLRDTDQTIGFLSGHGEPDLRQGLRTVNQLLKDQYFIRTVPTSNGEPIDPGEVSALVITAPQKLSERDLFIIDQYIMKGGRVLFLVDGVALDEAMQAAAFESPLNGLLVHYGIRVLPQLVLDRSNITASFQVGMYDVMLPYPFWVRVVRNMSASSHPVSSSIESMVMPWVSPLAVVDNATDDIQVDVLAQSSDTSWIQQEPFDLNPQQDFSLRVTQPGRRMLAVALNGTFTSFFAGRNTVPALNNAEGEALSYDMLSQSPDTRIIVAGSSRFITDDFTAEFEGNRAFFLNALDWLTIGDELIGIRSREAGERPLKLLDERTKMIVRIVNMLAVPLLVIAFGCVYTGLRRRRKRRYARELNGES
jgi:gliding-associated putative ABC transporter substrate-binding component GldG